MGRGLSDLQKTILRVALANRDRERRHADMGFEPPAGVKLPPCDVFRAEVLAEHFGWKSRYRAPVREHYDHWGQDSFSARKIGVARYRSAQASLSRALGRLQDRGLLVHGRWAFHRLVWIDLTPEGIRVAREISVNQVDPFHLFNR